MLGKWRSLGFSGDPFFVRPLRLRSHEAKLLANREYDVERLSIELNRPHSWSVVTGQPGVGATSLINAFATRAEQEAISDDVADAEARVLLLPYTQWSLSDPDLLHLELANYGLNALIDNKSFLNEWGSTANVRELTPLLRSRVLTQVGGSIAGTGVNLAAPNRENLFTEHRVTNQIKSALETAAQSAEVTFLAICNNAPLPTPEVLNRAAAEMNQWEGIKWLIDLPIETLSCLRAAPNVDGRLNDPIVLQRLDDQQTIEAVRLREDQFRSKPSPIPDSYLEDHEISLLHQLLDGDLRDILLVLAEYHIHADPGTPRLHPQDPALRGNVETFIHHKANEYLRTLPTVGLPDANIEQTLKQVDRQAELDPSHFKTLKLAGLVDNDGERVILTRTAKLILYAIEESSA